MRAALFTTIVLTLSSATAFAEDMAVSNPGGIMCRDEASLAEFTAPDGGLKNSALATPAIVSRFRAACRGAGTPVHVITKRTNTSIVTFEGATWYVANIDYMTITADCLKEGAHVTLTGKIELGFKQTDESNPKIGYRYPRLALDRPICFLGEYTQGPPSRFVALLGGNEASIQELMHGVGQRVTITGKLESPDNVNQPPDAMMMFAPLVKPAG